MTPQEKEQVRGLSSDLLLRSSGHRQVRTADRSGVRLGLKQAYNLHRYEAFPTFGARFGMSQPIDAWYFSQRVWSVPRILFRIFGVACT